MPRNPPGDAGSDVVPSSNSKAAAPGARSGGPKRPPRPARSAAPSVGPRDRATDSKRSKEPSANGSSTAGPGTKPAASRATAPVTSELPPGFVAAVPVTAPVAPAAAQETAIASARSASTPPPTAVPTAAQAPEPVLERTNGNRRGRRVTRVVRRIELWSVLKLSLALFSCLYLAVLGTLVVVWGVAYSSGQVERLQEFLADVGLENFRFYGDRMFKAVAAIGAVAVLAGAILAVLTTALVNLISEMTGGIRVVVIEEERRSRR